MVQVRTTTAVAPHKTCRCIGNISIGKAHHTQMTSAGATQHIQTHRKPQQQWIHTTAVETHNTCVRGQRTTTSTPWLNPEIWSEPSSLLFPGRASVIFAVALGSISCTGSTMSSVRFYTTIPLNLLLMNGIPVQCNNSAVLCRAMMCRAATFKVVMCKTATVQDSDVQDSNVQDRDVQDSNDQDNDVQDSNVQDSDVQVSDVQASNVQDSHVKGGNIQDSDVQDNDVQVRNNQSSDVGDSNVQDSGVQSSTFTTVMCRTVMCETRECKQCTPR
jgi:hypothetical protein